MTNKDFIKFYVHEGVKEKVRIIAESKNRSMSNLMECLVNELIAEYESETKRNDFTVSGNKEVG